MRLIFTAAIVCASVAYQSASATESVINYGVRPGNCKTINLPVDNKPVILTFANLQGSAESPFLDQITLMRLTSNPPTLLFIGGSSNKTGQVFFVLHRSTQLQVRIVPSAELKLCNSKGNTQNAVGSLTFMY